jgi:uncharacterized protein (TIRG00374 family)
VSIGILYFLFRQIDWNDLMSLTRQLSLPLLGAALAIILLAVLLSAYKWQRLLVVQHVDAPLPRLFVYYLIGLFFNNFLPTNIGGDVVRMHDLSKYTGRTSESVASVIAERLIAAFALALAASAGLLFSYRLSHRFGGLIVAILALALAAILIFAVERWRKALGKRLMLPGWFQLRWRLGSFGTSVGACMQNRANLVWVIALSIGFHCTVVLVAYFIFLSLGVTVPITYCLLFIPIISAMQMLPISISGFGVREGAYVYFFGSVGLSSAEAIASSLLFWVLVAVVSLAGGAVFALRR